MNNISLTTIKLTLFPAQGKTGKMLVLHDAEWLRETLNMLYNRKKESFRSAGVNTDSFHNHDEKSQNTIVRYSLIQCHVNKDELLVVGINEGAEAMQCMVELYENMVYLYADLYAKFEVVEKKQYEVQEITHPYRYRLKNYFPFSTDAYKEYSKLKYLKEKTDFIAAKIEIHILKDFAKHLNLPLNEAKVEIVDIESFHRPKVMVQANKHYHDFQPFDIVFDVAVDLPSGLCLGNGKTYGYGTLERIS